MDISTLLWILGGIQAVNTFVVFWIKADQAALWKRANSHGHKIECSDARCKPKTTAVILENR